MPQDDGYCLDVRRAFSQSMGEVTASLSITFFSIRTAFRPSLLRVKRQSDTGLRREVVWPDVLDYAANAVLHWSWERLRDQFDAECGDRGDDPASELANLIGPDGDADARMGNGKDKPQSWKNSTPVSSLIAFPLK